MDRLVAGREREEKAPGVMREREYVVEVEVGKVEVGEAETNGWVKEVLQFQVSRQAVSQTLGKEGARYLDPLF